MPIPSFDSIVNVLPPHLGDPRSPSDLSPYACTVDEICARFNSSAERLEILRGFLALRSKLFSLGIGGFHWIDGSFCEDIEAQEGRAPLDIDVVTFVAQPTTPLDLANILRPEGLLDRGAVKATYHVDHFVVSLGSSPALLVDHSRYWCGLFSHRRDRVWKGMLRLEMTDRTADIAAKTLLGVAP